MRFLAQYCYCFTSLVTMVMEDHGPSIIAHVLGMIKCVPRLTQSAHDKQLLRLGSAIKELRADRGLSQEALALLADVDRSYVGRIERGDNAIAVPTLIKIVHALGVTAAELMMFAKL